MSLPPSRPYPQDASSPSQFTLPPSAPPVAKRTVGSYLNYPLWKSLLQQAARHRYWMKGSALAYGIICCCLLGCLTMLTAASLWPSVAQFVTVVWQRWLPEVAAPMQAVVAQMSVEWRLDQRWWLFLISGGVSLGLWCKVVGLSQQIIRSDGDLASHLIPTLRQRLTTGVVAIAIAALTLLASGVVLLTLPESLQTDAQESVVGLIRKLLAQGLRWSLATSTMALSYGLLYRSSQKSSARSTPVLPGTVFATVLWLLTTMGLKHHLASLSAHHWLLSTGSTLLLGLLGLYVCTMGLLLGGQYNKLLNRYFPQPHSASGQNQVPPPSFDSFTIPKRPYR